MNNGAIRNDLVTFNMAELTTSEMAIEDNEVVVHQAGQPIGSHTL